MKRTAVSILVGIVVLATVMTPSFAADETEQTCLECRVKVLVKTHARGDVEKFVSYLSDDFRRVDVQTGEAIDVGDLRRVLEWDAELHGKIEYADLLWEGSTVTGTFTEFNDLYEMLDVEPRRYRAVFVFENDLLREQRIEVLPSEGPTLDEALAPAVTWISQRRAHDLSQIYTEGRVVRSRETAARWAELLTEWISIQETSELLDNAEGGAS